MSDFYEVEEKDAEINVRPKVGAEKGYTTYLAKKLAVSKNKRVNINWSGEIIVITPAEASKTLKDDAVKLIAEAGQKVDSFWEQISHFQKLIREHQEWLIQENVFLATFFDE
jgi:hypothetical protein